MPLILLKHWRLISAGIGVLALLGGLLYFGHTKYHEGYKAAEQACEAERLRTINERQRIRADQDNIIRPGTLEYIKRLRNGTA